MMTLAQMLEEWKTDSVVDNTVVTRELLRVPVLHAKYLQCFMVFKAKLTKSEKDYNNMAFLRKRYYRGEFTQQELKQYGWDQYQGLKMSMSEFNSHSAIDPVLVPLKEIVDNNKVAVVAAEYILKEISQRGWLLKTLVDYEKFQAGA